MMTNGMYLPKEAWELMQEVSKKGYQDNYGQGMVHLSDMVLDIIRKHNEQTRNLVLGSRERRETPERE